MSKYIDTINYLKNLAISDTQLRHTATVSGVIRNAFVSISDEDELVSDLINNLADVFVVQVGFAGNKQNIDGAVVDNFKHNLRFYAKAKIEDFAQPAIEAAYELAFTIMDHWQQKISNDAILGDGCGVFGYIDLGGFNFTKLPKLYDYHYGFQLSFTEENLNNTYLTPDTNYWQ